jgi:hypothetical protein
MPALAPAEVAVTYETYTFDSTEYAGPPTPEMDQKWHELYHRKLSFLDIIYLASQEELTILIHQDGVATRVSREEMMKITQNDTYELPNGEHLINLEMFHQLHCLVSK